MRRKQFGMYVVGAALGGALSLGAVYYAKASKSESAPQYTVARITRGAITQSVNAVGQLSPLVSVEVSSQISGLVTEVDVDFNSVVKKGQVLAKIDPATYDQKLHQAQANLEAARADHALALLNSRRLKGLRDSDLITQQDFDEAEARLEQARANLLTRKAAVENARVDLERCTLKSPIDGIVIYRQIEVGKTVVSSLSAPTLFTIARDLSQMRIVAPVSEVDIASVRPGQPVVFTIDAFGERKFEGRLVQIRNPYTPTDKQQTATQPQQSSITTFDVVIEVDNKERLLRPSLSANVSIIVDRRIAALRVPTGALRVTLGYGPAFGQKSRRLAESSGSIVYRLPNGDRNAAPQPVPVQLGLSDSGVTEVLGGLSEGDTVITGRVASIQLPKPRSFFF